MKTKNIFKLIILSAIIVLSSCSSDKNTPEPIACVVDAPLTYSFEHEGENTVSYSGQANRLAVAKQVYDALNGDVAMDRATIDAIIDNDNSKLFTKTAENVENSNSRGNATFSRSNLIDDLNSIIDTWCANSSTFADPNSIASAGNAGYYGSYQLDARGWESDQQYAKMLIGALCLEQVAWDYLTKMGDCSDGNTWCTDNEDRSSTYTQREHYYDEAFGYVYGLDDNDLDADINNGLLLGKYLNKHYTGNNYSGVDYRQRVYDAFKMGRQAVVDNCNEELERQIEIINSSLSKVVAWHAQDYLTSAASAIGTADFHHDVSEAWGFVYSLQFMKVNSMTVFSHSQVMGMLNTLDAGANGAWDLDAATLNSMASDINNMVTFD